LPVAPTTSSLASSLKAIAWPYSEPGLPVNFCDSNALIHPVAGLRNTYAAPRRTASIVCPSAPTAIVAPSPLIATAIPMK